MPGVVDERPLGGEGVRQAIEHLVELAGQPGDLVVADHRDASFEIGVGDRLGGLGQLAHRSKQAAGDEPRHGGRHDQDSGGDTGGHTDA